MSLQTRITALVQAIGADIKALYSGKVGTSDARLTDAREWTASTVSQAEAEAGTATTRRAWTAQRVFQAIAAWWAASAMKTKLDGIAAGATANATDAQLRDRATHTGSQAISTVTGLQTALDNKINTSERGVSGGVATLDEFARIPPSQLPSYVDDVLEYATTAQFPATGEGGKIYIAINQGTAANPTRQYRWTGSVYAEINPSPGTTDALAEGSTNLYFSEHRVRSTVLTGLSLAVSTAVTAADSVLSAFGKLQAQLGLKANLASPTFTGDPKAPTPAAEDADTSIATTAFVRNAMALFGLNNPSTQQAWHAGNLAKQTNVDDLSPGRLVLTESVRRLLTSGFFNTYCDRLILLHPLYVSTLLPYSIVDGKFTATRGSAGASLNQAVAEVVSSSAYNAHVISFYDLSGNPASAWQAVSCTYQGVKYAALIVPYTASAFGNGIYFEGRAVSDDPNQLLCVEYYNRNTATVLNAEVYNSIAPLPVNKTLRVGEEEVYHTGNLAKQTSATDTTGGAVMTVGAFGLGAAANTMPAITDFSQHWPTGIYQAVGDGTTSPTPNSPPGSGNNRLLVLALNYANSATQYFVIANSATAAGKKAFFGNYYTGTTTQWVEATHSGNFNPATKQDKSTLISTATSRTLAMTDAWNYLRPATTSAITLTVPTNASVAFAVGTEITVRALGNIALAAASGVTLNVPSGGTLNMTARMTVTLKKVGTNEWDVIGQTVAA